MGNYGFPKDTFSSQLIEYFAFINIIVKINKNKKLCYYLKNRITFLPFFWVLLLSL
jgi:hypothetical protein